MDDARPEPPLAFLGDPLPRWVDRHAVTIGPGDVRPYDEAEWRDALVIVEHGEVVLECTQGGRTTFRAGDVLWLVDVPVRRMRNDGVVAAVIVAISRRSSARKERSAMTTTPSTELDQRFSSEGVPATAWDVARGILGAAEIFWISTVRPDGRPHVTPLMTVLLRDSLYFCTGPTERKAKNLETNTHVALTTGGNSMQQGLDVIIEGNARRVTDDSTLQAASDLFQSKYGWRFDVRDGAFHSDDGGDAHVFEVVATKGFGFGKGEDSFSQTRWTF